MYPYLFEVAGFKMPTYGLFVAMGYIAGVFYLRSRLREIKLAEDKFWNLFTAVFVGAVLGGKILYAALFWDSFGYTFGERVINAVKDFRFGFVFYGGLAGGALSGWFYARRMRFPVLKLGDFCAPAVALGHAIGRIGCFMAGCCYGLPAKHGWGVVFSNPECLVDRSYLGVPLHPVQLYESASNFALFFLLRRLYGKNLKPGTVFLAYFAGYAAIRFFLEFMRGDERGGALFLSVSQIFALAISVICVVLYVVLSRGQND